MTTRLTELFDVTEHRILAAFLQVLRKRIDLCARAAADQIQTIAAERSLRDHRFTDGPTLYESIDVPKIIRLKTALRRANRSLQLIDGMQALPFLRNVKPELVPAGGGTFQRSMEYRELLRVIRSFLLSHALGYEGEDFSGVVKLTSRLFEQWCFLKIVDEFRASGLDLQDWGDVLRSHIQSMFVLDFNRGLQFEGQLTANLWVRIRYEPWILPEEFARRANETLFRASAGSEAWCPDIVVECLEREGETWEPAYVIVLDCKYTARIREKHWRDTYKYLHIRGTRSKRQVVHQLWLVAPGGDHQIISSDPAVPFGETGPSCDKAETAMFSMEASPKSHKTPRTDSAFAKFASGTINFFRRELI
jgi:hypothetical protein